MTADNTIYLKNLNMLKLNQPELAERVEVCDVSWDFEVVCSKNGLPVLKEKKVSFHSVYDPVKDGIRFFDVNYNKSEILNESIILFFGLGFGYHIKPVLEKHISSIIFEPRIEIIKTAMKYVDLTDIFKHIQIITEINEVFNDDRRFILWPHQPSVKNCSESYERLRKIIEGNVFSSNGNLVIKDKLKITVVSPIYGGSLPVAKYCADALKELGHEVDFWDASVFAAPFEKLLNMKVDDANRKILYDLFQHLISEMIVASCAEKKPDILFALAQAPVSAKALERLKQANIVTAFWFVEDYKHMEYWKSYAPFYDFYFTIQKDEFFNQLKSIGVNNYYYLPMAADPNIHCAGYLSDKEKNEFGSKISFMGAGYYNRQKILSRINNKDFKVWGNSWDTESSLWQKVQKEGQRVTTEDTVRIFNASDINLNLHSNAYDDSINSEGDFVNPRTFEIASCGAFQLVDKRSYLKDHFILGEEIVCFDTEEEMNRLIDHYLNNPEERKIIQNKARERVLKDHTYSHRMAEMLCFVKEKKPECFLENKSGMFAVKDKDGFINDYPEIEQLLNKASDENDKITIDSIVDVVKSRQSELKYHEAVFLLMDEFKNLFQEKML